MSPTQYSVRQYRKQVFALPVDYLYWYWQPSTYKKQEKTPVKHIIPPDKQKQIGPNEINTKHLKTSCGREAATICPRPVTLTFDPLTLKMVSESCVTWATFVPILVFLSLSVLDLGPMYATDRRQTSDRRQTASLLNASA